MKTVSPRKPGLHPRNRHQQRYDFAALQRACPALSAFLRPAPSGDQTIDFADPEAVKCLNKALLAHFYGVAQWDIPEGFLCPPVPGRADYIHYLADLLGDGGEPPRQAMILDVGVGANCIYPLIGLHEYGWRFTGSEVNEQALKSANAIIAANPGMARGIRLRRQKDPQAFFNGIIHKNERYDATLCNPPFHDSAEAARQSSERKRTNLGINNRTSALNFGGQQQELWCEGGEVAFIKGMIGESVNYAQQVLWFTTLVSRAENLPFLYRALQEAGAVKVVKMEMSQGQKQSRVIAWSFLDEGQRRRWAASRDGARD